MTQDCDQFAVAATSSRLWRPGDIIQPGQLIGSTIHGDSPIRAQRTVRVTNVQYDIDSDAVILQVEPAVESASWKRSRSILQRPLGPARSTNRGARTPRVRSEHVSN